MPFKVDQAAQPRGTPYRVRSFVAHLTALGIGKRPFRRFENPETPPPLTPGSIPKGIGLFLLRKGADGVEAVPPRSQCTA